MKRKRKAPKVQPADAGTQPALRWEREISDNKWQIFPPGQSEALSQATRVRKSTEDFGEDIVDLCKMVEWNKQSGEENRVRVAVWDQKSYLVWQWEGDQENGWIPYPAATCLDLQAAKNGHREPIVDLTVGRTRYKLDTDRMVQRNQRTKFERQMECRESDATEAAGGSQLNSRDLDASTAVPPKKSQTELDAPASHGEGDGLGDDIYDVMLNQTNLQFNNNKYYLIQLLEEDNAQNYSVWMRWGRAKAKDIFTKKFLDKTKNEWDKRNSFQKVSGKYDLLHLDYEARDAKNSAEAAPEKTISKPKPVSQLEPRVQALLELICNIRTMEEMVIEMKYDTRKAPLGKLTAEQIQAGYRSLQKVEACLKRSQTGAALLEACNEFYTRIPHDFGLKTPPLIKSLRELQEKAQLLEALSEIRIGIKHVQSEQLDLEHPLDRSYRSLDCELQPLEKASDVFQAHVYCEGDDIYDVMLNQTNLQFNNNKYYLIQLLEEDNAQNYSIWMRWGRVGKPGQHSLVPCSGDLAKAKDIFTKKFLDKTKNEWDKRNSFQKVSGKYDLLHLDYEARDANSAEAAPEKTISKPKPVSQLEPRVQALLELICNIRTMEEMVIEMKYDTRKAPLGKLTAEQIQAGYRSLQKVEACLKRSQTGAALLEACNEFYTRIPHDFGLKTPPLIKSLRELQEKAQLLEALSEIRIGIKHVQSEQLDLEHPLDRSYRSLDCELQPLEKASDVFQVLERYLLSTHAPTHKDYTMTLVEAFEVNKKSSEATFRFDLSNRMLLWHGSRLGNWAGILSQGLRVAPPEAPITGYMFGKGIYFADMSSKSANYCFATREKDIGLLLLSEVALGECNELLEADPEAERLPASKHSTKGLGKIAPASCVSLHDATVPLGPAVETGIANPRGYTLNYNEFIVYDPCQVRMKYLLKVRFNFVQLW
ncbi:poly [ADP-ribose] polymerase 2 [Protobothrops mucrosquamatus]|uniref:poly [ADP-ribose] polymerase 2 n=1 Tax=Protobothrops mucrosquamatus TaxID=103944 RepID=UPI000775EDDE|nr:poly [ADP-ribose] polymerase 2 [Protobothrops mucrosquamatus]